MSSQNFRVKNGLEVGIGGTIITAAGINSVSVGVGTTSPTTTLHVNGSLRIVGSIYDSNNSIGSTDAVLISVPGIGISWLKWNYYLTIQRGYEI